MFSPLLASVSSLLRFRSAVLHRTALLGGISMASLGAAQASTHHKQHHAYYHSWDKNGKLTAQPAAKTLHPKLVTPVGIVSSKPVAAGMENIRVSAVKHIITGGGMMVVQHAPKSRSAIAQAYISKQTPTLNPSYLIGALPGVQTSNEGPLVTSSETMHIRGLDQSQIGYLFEGIPLSDPFAYLIYTELAADNENLSSVSVTQGSTDLNASLHNADGAQLTMEEIRPSEKAGGYVDASGGTHSLNRQFLRLESGEIGNSGIKAFASFSHARGNMQRGPGYTERFHVDANAEKSWGEGNNIDAIFSFNNARQTVLRYPSLAQWAQFGPKFHLSSTYTPGMTTYYAINTKHTNALLGALKTHFNLGHGWGLDMEPYSIHENGPNNYGEMIPGSNIYQGTQLYSTLDGYQPGSAAVTVESVHPWQQTSSGITSALSWTSGNNILTLSDWYSYADHQEIQYQYPLDATGNWSYRQPYLTVGGKTATPYNINILQQVNAIALDDRLKLFNNRLTIDAGFKASMLSRMLTNDLPGASPYKARPNYFAPNPQLLISYNLTHDDQIYVNATTSYRAPASFQAYLQVFSQTSPRPTQQPPSNIAAEYMIGEEIGYRHNGWVTLALAAFNYNLTNHQISSTTFLPGTAYAVGTQILAGGEQAMGIQGEVATHPWHHISAYASAQYLHTRIGNNVNAGVDYLPTRGKSEPGAPKFMAATGLNYDDGQLFGSFTFRYSASQYSTLMNDQKMPSFETADLSVGHMLPSFQSHLHPKAMLTLLNVGGANYLSSINGFGFTAVTQPGMSGKIVKGGTPTYQIGSAFTAMGTISSDF